MQRLIRRIVQVLDGTPQAYGKEVTKGQSIVEITLVLPLLLILLFGLVEVGWFGRNYLLLLEVTRVGARRGATLQEEFSPLQWENVERDLGYSLALAPIPDVDANFCSSGPNCITDNAERNAIITARRDVRTCSAIASGAAYAGFYNLILCQMLDSIRPLEIRDNEFDDIVISVFSVLMINNSPLDQGGYIDLAATDTVLDDEFERLGFIPVVVGRWPTQANECNVWQNPDNGDLFMYTQGGPQNLIYERDPFDYYAQPEQGDRNSVSLVELTDNGVPTGELYPIELGEINPEFANVALNDPRRWRSIGFDAYNQPELQRGFVYLGQRKVDPPTTRTIAGAETQLRCWGSDKDVYWVQEQLLGGGFVMSEAEINAVRGANPGFCGDGSDFCDQREFVPNTGIVLVEIFWRHQLLFDLPAFSPVYQALDDNQTTIHVWSAFSTPSVIPRVSYTFEDGRGFIDPNP